MEELFHCAQAAQEVRMLQHECVRDVHNQVAFVLLRIECMHTCHAHTALCR